MEPQNWIPAVVPPGWGYFKDAQGRQAIHTRTISGLKILVSIDPSGPNGEWERHVSFSRQDRYPGWDEMKQFLYDGGFMNPALPITMILPPKNQPELYVNLHPYTFHWWQEEA